MASYKDRIFTTNAVGFNGVKHLKNHYEYQELIDYAMISKG